MRTQLELVFLVHKRRKGKIEEITLLESTKGRENRFSSFFFIPLSDHFSPIYAQSRAHMSIYSNEYILLSVFSHVLFRIIADDFKVYLDC